MLPRCAYALFHLLKKAAFEWIEFISLTSSWGANIELINFMLINFITTFKRLSPLNQCFDRDSNYFNKSACTLGQNLSWNHFCIWSFFISSLNRKKIGKFWKSYLICKLPFLKIWKIFLKNCWNLTSVSPFLIRKDMNWSDFQFWMRYLIFF